MTDRTKAAKVGIFTFVTGALLAIVLVIFGGIHLFKHKDRYYIDVDDSVMGLSTGTQVFFQGIHIGSVAEIKLDPDRPSRVKIAIDVQRGTPIHTDTIAMIGMAGITGMKNVDLKGGAATTPILPVGGSIPVGVGVFDKLQKEAEKIADQTDVMVTRASQIMDGANKIIANVQAATDPKALGTIIDSTRQMTANLASTSAEMQAMVTENRAALKTTFESIQRSSASIEKASGSIDQVTGSVLKVADNANAITIDMRALIHSNEPAITAVLGDIRQAARGFKELARELREKPSRLLLSSPASERKLP